MIEQGGYTINGIYNADGILVSIHSKTLLRKSLASRCE